MKQLFQIILKFSVIATISGFVCYYFYTINDNEEVLQKKSQTYDIINLGNSHGNSFDYYTFGVKGLNEYVEGSSPYYYKQLYTFYRENLNQDAVVVIPLSYFIFGRDTGANNSNFNDQFYSFLPPSLIRDYNIHKHVDLINNKITTNVLEIIEANKEVEKKDVIELDTMVRFRPYSYAKFSHTLPNQIKEKTIEGKKIALKQQRIFDYESVDNNIAHLSELIEDAQKNGFKPVLVTPPYLEVYYKNFSKTWLNENFYSHVKTLEDTYNIPYFDFSKAKEFSNNKRLFRDAHHVNNYGRLRFTKMFLNELSDISYINKNVSPIEIKELRSKVVDNDLILENVELFLSEGTEQAVLVFFFNKSLKQHFKNRNVKFKFLNGDHEIFRNTNKTDNFLFLKLNRLNQKTTILFEEENEHIFNENISINSNKESFKGKLNETVKLVTKPFQFNNAIQVDEIAYLNEQENKFTFIFKMKNDSDSNKTENFVGYIKYYNGEIKDQNKKITTFLPKLLEIDGYKYIFASVKVDNIELSKLDIFFIKKNPKEVSNFYTIKDLKLLKNVR